MIQQFNQMKPFCVGCVLEPTILSFANGHCVVFFSAFLLNVLVQNDLAVALGIGVGLVVHHHRHATAFAPFCSVFSCL
jgi:hypothetical protein